MLENYVQMYLQRLHKGEKQFEDYEELQSFAVDHGITYSIAASLLIGNKGMRGDSIYSLIRKGTFKVKTYKEAESMMKASSALAPFMGLKIHGTREWLGALNQVTEKYSVSEIKDAVKSSGKMISKQLNKQAYLDLFEEISNGKIKV